MKTTNFQNEITRKLLFFDYFTSHDKKKKNINRKSCEIFSKTELALFLGFSKHQFNSINITANFLIKRDEGNSNILFFDTFNVGLSFPRNVTQRQTGLDSRRQKEERDIKEFAPKLELFLLVKRP